MIDSSTSSHVAAFPSHTVQIVLCDVAVEHPSIACCINTTGRSGVQGVSFASSALTVHTWQLSGHCKLVYLLLQVIEARTATPACGAPQPADTAKLGAATLDAVTASLAEANISNTTSAITTTDSGTHADGEAKQEVLAVSDAATRGPPADDNLWVNKQPVAGACRLQQAPGFRN